MEKRGRFKFKSPALFVIFKAALPISLVAFILLVTFFNFFVTRRNKMRLLIIFSIALFSSMRVFAQAAPIPARFQSWNETQIIAPLKQKKNEKGKTVDLITATFSGIVRIGRSNLDLVDNRAAVTLDFRLNKYASLLAGGMYRKDEIVKNVRRYETRFFTGGIFSLTWRDFTFRDRNMFEHRFRNGRQDLNLYRQRIQVSRPVKYKGKEMFSPVISEEGYFDTHSKIWIQNEFFAGITRRLNKKTTLDIAYIRNDQSSINVNGISLNLRFKLR